MNDWLKRLVMAACVMSASLPLQASNLDAMFAKFQTMDADFVQRNTNLEFYHYTESTGRIWVKRPNLLKLVFTKPSEQQIIADGTYLWVMDSDLEQATVYQQHEVLGTTPLILLLEPQKLREEYRQRLEVKPNGEPWYVLEAKERNHPYQQIELKMREDRLIEAVIIDQEKNEEVRLTFHYRAWNSVLADSQFKVNVPMGMDVIGEGR